MAFFVIEPSTAWTAKKGTNYQGQWDIVPIRGTSTDNKKPVAFITPIK